MERDEAELDRRLLGQRKPKPGADPAGASATGASGAADAHAATGGTGDRQGTGGGVSDGGGDADAKREPPAADTTTADADEKRGAGAPPADFESAGSGGSWQRRRGEAG